jgi:hypothetical protein
MCPKIIPLWFPQVHTLLRTPAFPGGSLHRSALFFRKMRLSGSGIE